MPPEIYGLAYRPTAVELLRGGIIDHDLDVAKCVGAKLTGEHRTPEFGEWYVPRREFVAYRCEPPRHFLQVERIARLTWIGPPRGGIWGPARAVSDVDALVASIVQAALAPTLGETAQGMDQTAAATFPGLAALLSAAGWTLTAAECQEFIARRHRLVAACADLAREAGGC